MCRTTRIAIGTAAALGGLGAVEALLCLGVLVQWRRLQAPDPATPAEGLTFVIMAGAALLGAWLAATTVTAVVAHLPGRVGAAADRLARTAAPAVCRRVAAVLVGTVVGGALAPGTALGDGPGAPSPSGPAPVPGFTVTSRQHVAGEDGGGRSRPRDERSPGFELTPGVVTDRPSAASDVILQPTPGADGQPAPGPGWTPSRPVQRPLPHPGLVTRGAAPASAADVVVHRGDTLWDIARRDLGADATDAEVAHAWPAWHEANLAVIGDDPDLLLPGQVLRRPPTPSLAARWSGAER
jgi:hypothetical protein